jgi:hypothetical protein
MSIKIEQRTDNHRSARQVPQPRSGGAPYAVVRSTKWAACGLGRVELKVRRGHAPLTKPERREDVVFRLGLATPGSVHLATLHPNTTPTSPALFQTTRQERRWTSGSP